MKSSCSIFLNNIYFYDPTLFQDFSVLIKNHNIITNELIAAMTARQINIDEENGQKLFGTWCENEKMSEFFNKNKTVSGWLHWWTAEEKPHKDWTVFPLVYEGILATENCKLVPETAKLLSQVPGIRVAGFSLLKPNAIIETHCGFTGRRYGALTFHLGLIIPPNSCTLTCGPKTHKWTKQGESIVFDDTFPHSATNSSNEKRVVLYIDFKIPKDVESKLPEIVDYEKIKL